MQAALATLCEAARVRADGTVDVHGASPEWIGVAELPWRGTLNFALVLQLEAVDDLSDLRLGVVIVRGSDRKVVGQVEAGALERQRSARPLEGAPPYLPFALELETAFDAEGQYAVVVRNRDADRLAFVPFVVRLES